MYEFIKQGSNSQGIKRGDFAFRKLESFALKFFVTSPRLVTLILHAGLLETTPIHCLEESTRKVHDFFVPKQRLNIHHSVEGLVFTTVKVFSEEGEVFWLVVCEWNRQGFLLPDFILNNEGEYKHLSFQKQVQARKKALSCHRHSRRLLRMKK